MYPHTVIPLSFVPHPKSALDTVPVTAVTRTLGWEITLSQALDLHDWSKVDLFVRVRWCPGMYESQHLPEYFTHLQIAKAESRNEVLISVTLQSAEAFRTGVQVQLDPETILRDYRYTFNIVLVFPHLPDSRNRSLLSKRLCCRSSPLHGDCYSFSQEAKERLRRFLQMATTADVLIRVHSRNLGTLHITTHSCILRTLGSQLLKAHLDGIGCGVPLRRGSGSGTRTCDPIATIGLEDIPPEAVMVVVKYIYYGEPPGVWPSCGYSVMDIMTLAARLEIECLQDHCVDLVLGRHVDLSQESRNGSGSSTTVLTWGHHWTCPAPRNLRAPWCRQSPEVMLKTLFDWGYKFEKTRVALVRALMMDKGHVLSESGPLWTYKRHPQYESLLIEMIAESSHWPL